MLKENVGAEALGGNDLAIVEVGTVEVGVVPDVGSLTHAAAAVAVDFFKAAVFGAVRVVVAEVPFAEHCRWRSRSEKCCPRVTSFSRIIERPMNGVPDAGAVGPVAAEKRGTGRRAGRSNVVVGEDRGFVEWSLSRFGRLDDRITVAGQIAVALVIGDHDDDVGFRD